MNTLNSLKLLTDTGIGFTPSVNLPKIFNRLTERFYYEFFISGEKVLLSPYYSVLSGILSSEAKGFIEDNEELLDQIKEYVIKYLFFYSAVIEDNFPYLTQPNDIAIYRFVHRSETIFEVKLYAHNEMEVDKFYNDKFYIGRTFIDLANFYPRKLLLPVYLQSVYDQNIKLQERARLKLSNHKDYSDELQEINELCREIASESCDLFPDPGKKGLFSSSKLDLDGVLDQVLEINEVTVELKDILQDFEMKLRTNDENDFVKNLVKFNKDIVNFYQYIHKIFCILSYQYSLI